MNENDRILQMVSEGVLRPEEAAKLLAALSQPAPPPPPAPEPPRPPDPPAPPKAPAEEKKPQPTMEVQMQRPDGTYYTVQVPTGLIPAVMKIAGVSIKESVKQNSKEAWDGFKVMMKRKADEVKTSVHDRVTGAHKEPVPPETPPSAPEPARPSAPKADRSAERQMILQMVQNGRLSASEASRLIESLDA